MLNQQTLEKLHALRLTGMAEAYRKQMEEAEMAGLSFEERFGLLVDQHWTWRENQAMARRLKRSKLDAEPCVEDINYRHPRGLDRSLMRTLTSSQWVARRLSILFIGSTGLGKSWLAQALAQKACRDGYTGQVAIDRAGLTRILRKDTASMEADLGELHGRGVCERQQDRVEICDRFWPYQKQVVAAAGSPEAEFVRQARQAFLEPACVRSAFTAADEKLALNLCRRGVSLEQLRWAIWLGCARKYTAMLNGQTRLPITSLSYFACLTDEVVQPQIPASYWEHVRRKTEEMEKRWLQVRNSAPALVAVPAELSPPETA